MITNSFEVLQVVKYLLGGFGGFGQVFFTTFNLMFNYMKYFEFVTTIFENHMFKIHLYIFIKIICKCYNLQNRLKFKHK
jgi:hypothetical protein